MFRNALVSAIALAPIVGSTMAAASVPVNLIMNGSFEMGTAPGALGYSQLSAGNSAITDWTIAGDSIDYISTYWTASNDSSRSLDLNGATTGKVQQQVSLTSGQQYLLNFDLAGNPDDAGDTKYMEVVITNGSTVSQTYSFDTTGNTRTDMGWVTESLLFTADATANYTFTFASLDTGPYGPALDNVTLSAVPLPPAVILFGSALVGVTLLGRRRRGEKAARWEAVA